MTPFSGFQFGQTSLLRGALVVAATALLGSAATAEAQQYPLQLPQGTAAQPQRATKAKPRPEEQEPSYPANPLYPAFPVGVTWIPAIMMSDGTVWANFGYGYVQVPTACARPGRVLDSRGLETPSRRREPTRSPCYARNAHGSLVVTR